LHPALQLILIYPFFFNTRPPLSRCTVFWVNVSVVLPPFGFLREFRIAFPLPDGVPPEVRRFEKHPTCLFQPFSHLRVVFFFGVFSWLFFFPPPPPFPRQGLAHGHSPGTSFFTVRFVLVIVLNVQACVGFLIPFT